MRTAALLLLLSSLAAAGCATAPPAARPARAVVHGGDCLDPTAARGWHALSSDEILLDAGRRKYRVRLSRQCLGADAGQRLVFEGDPLGGRICGAFGDAVRLEGGRRCPIEGMERIDDATFEALRDRGLSGDALPSSGGSAGSARNPDRSSPR